MNRIFWSILCISPLFLYLLTGSANGQSLKTYDDPSNGLRFQYPSEWSIDVYNSAIDGTDVILVPNDVFGFRVIIKTYLTNQTLKDASSRLLHISGQEGAVLNKIFLSGLAGYKSIGSSCPNNKQLIALALKETSQGVGKIYSVTFVASDIDFDLYLEDVDKIIESFAINPTDQQILDQYQKQQNGMKVRNLQILHNHLVDEDQKHDCKSRMDSINVFQKNKKFLKDQSELDQYAMQKTISQLNKEQGWYNERCSNWKAQTNLTKFDIEVLLNVIP